MSAAVQLSGLADRIGMAQSTQVVQTKMLDYFFSLRKLHTFAFQPIVTLATGRAVRVRVPLPAADADAAAVDQLGGPGGDQHRPRRRARHLHRGHRARAHRPARGDRSGGRHAAAPLRHQPDAVQPARSRRSRRPRSAAQVRAAGLEPRQITIECTEQQSVPDLGPLQRQVKALRRLGFGFAVDDAGAGYASFALIAALKPSVIKIDRDIVHGLNHDDAKQALVEAFVSFGRRIGAHLLAEGIERRADLAALTSLGVELGQGYLLGKPAADPQPPRLLTKRVKRKAPARAKPRVAVRRASRVPSRA